MPKSLIFTLEPHLLATWLRVKAFDWNGRGCTAAMETLAAGTASERQLRRNIRALQQLGLLRVIERPGQTAMLWALDPQTPATDGADTDVQGGGRRRPPNKIQKPDPEGQQPTPPPAVVVPSDESQGVPLAEEAPGDTAEKTTGMAPDAPGGDILALNIPPDLAALPSRVRGLSGATVRRLVAAHGPEVVRRAVATIEQSYPNKAAIRVFGALLQRTIAEGWMSTQQEEQTKKETQEAAIVAAAPPDGTRWAERDGQVLEVLEVSTSAVRTATGVIPRSNWPEWTFRIDEPPVSVPSPATPTEGASPLDHEERVETLRKMKAMPMTRRLAAKLATEWGIDLGAV